MKLESLSSFEKKLSKNEMGKILGGDESLGGGGSREETGSGSVAVHTTHCPSGIMNYTSDCIDVDGKNYYGQSCQP